MTKKFEILKELPKCDTETQSEQMLLEKWHQKNCFVQGHHRPSLCKKQYLWSATMQSTVMRCACKEITNFSPYFVPYPYEFKLDHRPKTLISLKRKHRGLPWTQVSINRWIDKQNAICLSNGILFSLKKEWRSYICHNRESNRESRSVASNSLPDHRIHGVLQARTLGWVALPFPRGIFPTQGSNPGLPHCRQILYQMSHKRSYNIDEPLKHYAKCNKSDTKGKYCMILLI